MAKKLESLRILLKIMTVVANVCDLPFRSAERNQLNFLILSERLSSAFSSYLYFRTGFSEAVNAVQR